MLIERGTTFGYQDLIVDYRGIPEMQAGGFPVVLDVTHSLQQPNQTSGVTGGMPRLIETIARAGVAACLWKHTLSLKKRNPMAPICFLFIDWILCWVAWLPCGKL